MKITPAIVTTLRDVKTNSEIFKERTRDTVKKKIREILNNVIVINSGVGLENRIQAFANAEFQRLVQQNVINNYSVDSVEITPHKPLREVDCLPLTAKPGDALVAEEANENGDVFEVYRGVIISSDGNGNGIVFSEPRATKEGQIKIRCSVRPSAMLETIVIEVKQDY